MVTKVQFNPTFPNIMHIDLNSCFASVEQQANPLLRNRPVAVVHSDTPYGCILAPSVEAKLWGVKTGMTLSASRTLCPWLIARVADPPKYRQIHSELATLLQDYSPHVISKSIDEFVLTLPVPQGIHERTVPIEKIVQDIKSRIKSEIGDYLRVSIGVSTNQILAKLASGLHKPDGFDVIDSHNFMDTYQTIALQDLCGINIRNEARLHRVGIFTVSQFYDADIQKLKQAFESILGRYWHTRLRGYETDDVEFSRQSFGQSYVLPHPMEIEGWRPILAKLVAKAARRMRGAHYSATGIHLYLRYADGTYWHAGHQFQTTLTSDNDLLSATLTLYSSNSVTAKLFKRSVKKIAFTCFGLAKQDGQLSAFSDIAKQNSLTTALDVLNSKWGEYSVTYGSMIGSAGHIHDAIAFGK